MKYSERDLKTMDAFALCLVFIGGLVWLIAARPYIIDKRYLKAAYGVTQPRILPIPAALGTVLLLTGGILNFAIIHHRKSGGSAFKPDSQS